MENGKLFRQVNDFYRTDYDQAVTSGLYQTLIDKKLLIPHQEVAPRPNAYRILRPEQIPFISYPYEWSFSQLQDAALVTLEIQLIALEHGMSLKDASAYNIQFRNGRPIFIDTLSFETYVPGRPWVAYRQFCQHFLAPLALMSYRDVRLSQLLRVHIDGLPLDLTCRLLPFRCRFNPELASHLYLHAATQKRYAARPKPVKEFKLDLVGLRAIINSLASTVRRLRWQPAGTEWADYYDQTNYSPAAFGDKEKLVAEMINEISPTAIWDLGANSGKFSRLASRRGILTVAMDYDPAAVEKLYRDIRSTGEPILPLVIDLTNPSPAIGWAHQERESLTDRGPVDCVLALALVHHLAIGNNVPFDSIVSYLAELSRSVIIEFIPKRDSQVQRLLAGRQDVFSEYDQAHFEQALAGRFTTVRRSSIPGSERTLYLLKLRPAS